MKQILMILVILSLVIACDAQAYNVGYAPKTNFQPNLKKLDSTLKKTLGYETGRYWNTLWAKYFALDDFKGLRSMYDPNIVRYNLYSKDFPLILVNDLSLIFYDIGKIEFTKIYSAIFWDSTTLTIKKQFPFLQYGVLKIKADIRKYASNELNFGDDLLDEYKFRYNYDVSPVSLNSFLDSVLLTTLGYNRNQCYNLRIYKYLTEVSCTDCKPLLYSNQLVHGQLPPAPIRIKDTAYYVYVNNAPIELLDDANWEFNRQKNNLIVNAKKTIERNGDRSQLIPTLVRVDIFIE